MNHVTACIDGSTAAIAVCDCAVWASDRLQAPLTFLHVLDDAHFPVRSNLSGNIGLGSREHLLEELASLDEQRARLALDQGRLMLEGARSRAADQGNPDAFVKQRHGNLVDALKEIEAEIRLLVLGIHGEASATVGRQVGSHVENVVRTQHRPILIVPDRFAPPQRPMVAFDGSPTTRRAVELLAGSPLLRGLPIHLVMVDPDRARADEAMIWAKQTLAAAGFDTLTAVRSGNVEDELHAYQAEFDIDLLVMGAYGHSRIREFLIGSTTTRLMKTATIPLLLLR